MACAADAAFFLFFFFFFVKGVIASFSSASSSSIARVFRGICSRNGLRSADRERSIFIIDKSPGTISERADDHVAYPIGIGYGVASHAITRAMT